MFSLFSNKDNKSEDYSDEDSSDESEIDGGLDYICELRNLTIYKADARVFLPSVQLWSFNRLLDPKRIKEIKTNILKGDIPLGTIKCCDFEGTKYLIDGQHRRKAALSALRENVNLNFEILVECYTVNSEREIVEIFRKINDIMPLQPSETPDTILVDVIDELCKIYTANGVCAIRHSNKTVYPYIIKGDLEKKLKPILSECNFTKEKLISEIERINRIYSIEAFKNPMWLNKKITNGTNNKLRKTGFYLGLDQKFLWIEELRRSNLS